MKHSWHSIGGWVLASCLLVLVLGATCERWSGDSRVTHSNFGAHAELNCEQCHIPPSPPDMIPADCESCHENTAPTPHFELECMSCHTVYGWEQTSYDHGSFTLLDSHDRECAACHTGDDYTGLVADCSTCHEAERPSNHFGSTDCQTCHTPTVWSSGRVDHSFFALEAAHNLECDACHSDTQTYQGLQSNCSSCHAQTRPDDHFPGQDCAECHLATAWEEAVVNHSFLPLTRAHNLPCNECHEGGESRSLSATCTSCHDRPTGHFSGESCSECHIPNRWTSAEFNHRSVSGFRFDIPHGEDSQTARVCEDCHLASPDYRDFSCTHCHEHRLSEMNDEHRGEDGYRYESTSCFRCHPDGDD
jgi:hypothetical protein